MSRSSLCSLWLHAAELQHVSDFFFVLRNPQLETVLEMQSHKCWMEELLLPTSVEWKNYFSWLAVCAFTNTDQFAVDLCHMGILLARVQLGVHQDLQVLFCKAAFYPPAPSLSWCIGIVHPSAGLCLCWASWGFCQPMSPSSLWRSFLIVSLPSVHFWWHRLSFLDVSWSWPSNQPNMLSVAQTSRKALI